MSLNWFEILEKDSDGNGGFSLNQDPEDGPFLLSIGTESQIKKKTDELDSLATQTILIARAAKFPPGMGNYLLSRRIAHLPASGRPGKSTPTSPCNLCAMMMCTQSDVITAHHHA